MELGDVRRVVAVEDERVEPRRVRGRDADGRDREAAGAHQLAGRPAHGRAAHDRAHADDAGARGGQAVGHAGHSEHGADGGHGVGRAYHDHVGLADGLQDARRGARARGPGVLDLEHLDLRLLAHEVLLEREPAVGRPDARAYRIVAHREDARGDAQASRELRGDRRQRRARA